MGTLSGRLVAAVVVSLVATTLSACSGEGGAAGDEPASEPTGSRLEQALTYLPADSRAVTFTDRAAVTERLGLTDVTSDGSEADVTGWVRAFVAEGYRLSLSVSPTSMQDAAFSELDVAWSAIGGDGSMSPGNPSIWRMADDLDLDAVAEDLEDAGLRRSGPEDRPVFEPDIGALDDLDMYDGRYPIELGHLTLLPDEHLILTGFGTDAVLDVVDDKTDSLAEAGTFDGVLAHTETSGVEYALVGLAGPCTSAGRHPDGKGVGFFVHPDQPARSVRLFASTASAQADAGLLEEALAGHPVTIGVDGTAVHVDVPFDARVTADRTYLGADGPLACPR